MTREEIKKGVLAYLGEFFDTFMLYKKFSVKQKMYSKLWAIEMYDKLTDKQKVGIYLKQTKKIWKEE